MKNGLLLIAGLFSLYFAKAQGYMDSRVKEVDAFVEAYDANGQLIGSNVSPVGSPMLYEQWARGEVAFKNGQVLKNLQLQFNLAHQQLRFQKDGKTYMFSEPLYQFHIQNPDSSFSVFRNGYPVEGKNDDYTFYQVLADGRPLQLLMHRYKSSNEVNEYNGPTTVHFTEWNKFYIYNSTNNQLAEVGLQKGVIKKRVPELAPLLDQYPSRQLTLKQLAAAVEAYNMK